MSYYIRTTMSYAIYVRALQASTLEPEGLRHIYPDCIALDTNGIASEYNGLMHYDAA